MAEQIEYIIRKTVSLQDNKYFCNRSWTLSFNMNTKSWISFHSYIPNWYMAENNFFYSGINACCEEFDFIAGTLVANPTLTTTTTIACTLDAVLLDALPTTSTTSTSSTTSSTTTTTSTTAIIPTTTTTTTCYNPPYSITLYYSVILDGENVYFGDTYEHATEILCLYLTESERFGGFYGYMSKATTSIPEIGLTLYDYFDPCYARVVSNFSIYLEDNSIIQTNGGTPTIIAIYTSGICTTTTTTTI